jgi:hypothetical protein
MHLRSSSRHVASWSAVHSMTMPCISISQGNAWCRDSIGLIGTRYINPYLELPPGLFLMAGASESFIDSAYRPIIANEGEKEWQNRSTPMYNVITRPLHFFFLRRSLAPYSIRIILHLIPSHHPTIPRQMDAPQDTHTHGPKRARHFLRTIHGSIRYY